MPVYEYRCSKCGNVFERIQKMSDAPLTVHDECGGTVEKLISRSGFHLKGSGWYATDYGKGNGGRAGELKSSEKQGEKSESKNESKSESKGESKGESKSESSSDSKPAASESKPASSDSKPAPASSDSK